MCLPEEKRGAVTDPIHERGMAVRRKVLGDEHVDNATARASDFTRDWRDSITRYAWGGEIWARPGSTAGSAAA
jgi:3-oxoadipate enol-lactonase / 4-carboxymuconolactone decarboxylase